MSEFRNDPDVPPYEEVVRAGGDLALALEQYLEPQTGKDESTRALDALDALDRLRDVHKRSGLAWQDQGTPRPAPSSKHFKRRRRAAVPGVTPNHHPRR